MEVLTGAGAGRGARRRLWIDLWIFAGATFALTWAIVGAYIYDAEAATRILGPMKLGAPAFYAAVCAPSLMAIVVTALRYGKAGLGDLFASLFRVRAGWAWIALSVLAFPVLCLVVALARAAGGGGLAGFDFAPWLVALPAILLAGHLLTDPGALGEELGWRGFALPRLLELTDARRASLALGLVWAVWHLPAFYVGSLSQAELAFVPFVLRVVAYSAFMTWLFVNTRGSVLWAGVVPHMMFNATPRAGIVPVDWTVIAAGVVILVLVGRHMRGRGRSPADLPQSRLLRAP